MVHPSEHPDRHPIKEGWAQEGGCVIEEQDELERRWLQASLVTIGEVAHNVAQEVQVEDVVPILAGICPGGEDESFCS